MCAWFLLRSHSPQAETFGFSRFLYACVFSTQRDCAVCNQIRAAAEKCVACCVVGQKKPKHQAGKYLTGALNLTSNMVVQLDSGAEILGSLDAADYPLVEALPGYGITRDSLDRKVRSKSPP